MYFTYNVRVRITVVAVEKQKALNIMSVSVCILALAIRHAEPIFSAAYYIVVCGLSVSTIFFYIISQTTRFSKKNIIKYKICALIFSTNLSEKFRVLRRTQRDIIIIVLSVGPHVKYPLFLSGFN
jgi:hypothetical protein